MRFVYIFLTCLLYTTSALALEPPALRSHVNDYAALLSPAVTAQLEQQLQELEKSDSTQVVILTVPSLEGDSLEDFSIRVAEKWRIGQKGVDNGVILLISKAEHKIRIEVGRGLEGKLTDLISGRIIRNDIAPKFKSNDFDGGVAAGVSSLIAV
ncbi:MAG: methanol dehydrogenase, partial [Geobacter sp.]|nr:methanol dehydrogenase [Geobacter sp.]